MSKVLKTLDILIHPFCPFTSEYLYQTVFEEKQSILLDKWPAYNESLVNEEIEESFDIMKDVVSISSAARMKGKLKRRWPLNEALICVKKGQKQKLESLSELLQSQLNVEKFSIFETEKESGLEQISELKQLGLPARGVVELREKELDPKQNNTWENLLQSLVKQIMKRLLHHCKVILNMILILMVRKSHLIQKTL